MANRSEIILPCLAKAGLGRVWGRVAPQPCLPRRGQGGCFCDDNPASTKAGLTRTWGTPETEHRGGQRNVVGLLRVSFFKV